MLQLAKCYFPSKTTALILLFGSTHMVACRNVTLIIGPGVHRCTRSWYIRTGVFKTKRSKGKSHKYSMFLWDAINSLFKQKASASLCFTCFPPRLSTGRATRFFNVSRIWFHWIDESTQSWNTLVYFSWRLLPAVPRSLVLRVGRHRDGRRENTRKHERTRREFSLSLYNRSC